MSVRRIAAAVGGVVGTFVIAKNLQKGSQQLDVIPPKKPVLPVLSSVVVPDQITLPEIDTKKAALQLSALVVGDFVGFPADAALTRFANTPSKGYFSHLIGVLGNGSKAWNSWGASAVYRVSGRGAGTLMPIIFSDPWIQNSPSSDRGVKAVFGSVTHLFMGGNYMNNVKVFGQANGLPATVSAKTLTQRHGLGKTALHGIGSAAFRNSTLIAFNVAFQKPVAGAFNEGFKQISGEDAAGGMKIFINGAAGMLTGATGGVISAFPHVLNVRQVSNWESLPSAFGSGLPNASVLMARAVPNALGWGATFLAFELFQTATSSKKMNP